MCSAEKAGAVATHDHTTGAQYRISGTPRAFSSQEVDVLKWAFYILLALHGVLMVFMH